MCLAQEDYKPVLICVHTCQIPLLFLKSCTWLVISPPPLYVNEHRTAITSIRLCDNVPHSETEVASQGDKSILLQCLISCFHFMYFCFKFSMQNNAGRPFFIY